MALDEDQYSLRAHMVEDSLPKLDLLGPLYAVLTLLSVLSVRALTRSIRRARPTVITLCLTIFTLFIATTTDLATYVVSTQYTVLQIIRGASNMPMDYPSPATLTHYLPLQHCVSTAAMTVNMTLGDAIVCWRACAIWRKNRVVRAVCGIFVLATFILAAVDTWKGCRAGGTATQISALYGGVPVGIDSCIMSLSTNMIATLLVGYKAWRNRRRLPGSQVGKLFTLLIESGAIYCAMWVLVVAFQTAENKREILLWFKDSSATGGPPPAAWPTFLDAFGVVFGVIIVHVVSIYPMIIIVLVAQGRSHIEMGLSHHLETAPTLHLDATVDTIARSASQCEMAEVVIGPNGQGIHGQGPGCPVDSMEEAGIRRSKEWKLEIMV